MIKIKCQALAFSVFLFLFAFGCIALPVLAQPVPDKKPELEEPDYDVDFSDIESYGLYNRPRDGSLGRDLWSKTPRSAIIGNINWIADQNENIILQKIFFGALLSKTNAGLIINDIDPKVGEDLLTIRINKLLAMGAYKQAAELYTLSDDDPYHPDLAFAGISALLGAGDKSLACLEAKNAQQSFAFDAKIREVSAFCDLASGGDLAKTGKGILKGSSFSVLKDIASNENYKRSYASGSLAPLSGFELGVLYADGRLKVDGLSEEDIKTMNPRYIMLFLDQESLSEKQHFILMQEAARWGLISYDDLEELYEDYKVPEGKAPQWAELAVLYHELDKSARGKESWDVLSKALALGMKEHPSALMPFVKQLERADVDDANLQDIAYAVALLNYAGAEISEDWAERLKDIASSAQKNDEELYQRVFSALYIAMPQYKREDIFKDSLQGIDNTYKKSNKDEVISSIPLAILDYFKTGSKQNDTENLFYEKRFLLTFNQDYVMPTYKVWDRLHRAAENGSIGETILLSSNILRNLQKSGAGFASKQNLYPGTLRSIIGSLDKVGLTQFSRQLAIGLVLEL